MTQHLRIHHSWIWSTLISAAIKNNIYELVYSIYQRYYTNSMYTIFSSKNNNQCFNFSIDLCIIHGVWSKIFAASLLNRNQGFGVARCVSAALQVGFGVWRWEVLEFRMAILGGNPGFQWEINIFNSDGFGPEMAVFSISQQLLRSENPWEKFQWQVVEYVSTGCLNNLGTSGSGLNGKVSNVGLLVTVQLIGEHPKRWVYFTHVWCWFLETHVDISTTSHASHRPWTTVDLQWSERRSCTSVKMAVISHAVGQIIAAAGMGKNNFDCLLKIHKVLSCSYNNWI